MKKNKKEIFTYFDLVFPLNWAVWIRKKFTFPSDINNRQDEQVAKNDRIRKYLFFLAIILIHGLMFLLVLIYNPSFAMDKYLPVSITSFLGEILIISYIYDGKHYYIKNDWNLYRQLEEYICSEKSEEVSNENVPQEFRDWYYEEHLKPMYGFINKTKDKLTLDLKEERPYWRYAFLFVIIWFIFAVLFSLHKTDNILYWISRSIDSLIYWLIVSYVLRVIICSVKIIEDYELKGLSSPFSRFNNYGFNFLIRAWKKMMFYFIPFWILFWSFTSFAYKHNIYLDTIYVTAAIILAGFWSIKTSKRTILLSRKIRRETLYKYEKKILEKRDDLLRNPTNATLFDLNKTIKIYREYEKIMMKDFHANYIIAVLLNIWVFLIPLLYWLLFVIYYQPLNIGVLYGFAF